MAAEKSLKEEIKFEEMNEESSMSFSEVCRFTIFSALFVAIVLNQIGTEKSFQIYSGISQALASADPSDVKSADDVIVWISESFLPVISDKKMYFDWELGEGENDFLRVNMMNRIITPLRFVQKRMALEENTNPRSKSLVRSTWKSDKLDPYIDNKEKEDKSSFIPEHLRDGEKKKDDDETYSMYVYLDHIGVSGSGGFMYEVDLKNKTKVEEADYFFKGKTWINSTTAIIYVDFVTYNSHYAMLTYVNYLFILLALDSLLASSRLEAPLIINMSLLLI